MYTPQREHVDFILYGMKLVNVTPQHLRCSFGGCPAVFKSHRNTLVVIGAIAADDFHDELKGKISSSERAIEISPEFFKTVFKDPQIMETESGSVFNRESKE